MLKVGIVHSILATKGAVTVTFDDEDDLVSKPLLYLDHEYRMPEIGAQVLCAFMPNGGMNGFCLGSFYSEKNKPSIGNESIERKSFSGTTFVEYDRNSGVLEVTSDKPIVINGDLEVSGDVTCSNVETIHVETLSIRSDSYSEY